MVATGRADFGTVGADEVITARARGADVVALFAVFKRRPRASWCTLHGKLQKLKTFFIRARSGSKLGSPTPLLKKKFSWNGVKIVPYDGGVAHFLA